MAIAEKPVESGHIPENIEIPENQATLRRQEEEKEEAGKLLDELRDNVRTFPTEAELKANSDYVKNNIIGGSRPETVTKHRTHNEAGIEMLEEIPLEKRADAASRLITNPGDVTKRGGGNELFNKFANLHGLSESETQDSELDKAA